MTDRTPTGIYFETKKKPFDIQIDNNKKEPKLSKNIRFTDKHNYRRYKTLTEPKVFSRIMVDDDSANVDIQDKIQKLLGIKVPPKKDERLGENEDVFTAPSPYVAPPKEETLLKTPTEPKPTEPKDEMSLTDISKRDVEELLGSIVDDAVETSQETQKRIQQQNVVEDLAKRVLKTPNINLETDEGMNDLLRTIDEQEERLRLLESARTFFGVAQELFPKINKLEATNRIKDNWKGHKAREELRLRKEAKLAQSQSVSSSSQQENLMKLLGDDTISVGSSVLSGASTLPSTNPIPSLQRRGRKPDTSTPATTRSKSQGRTLNLF